MAGGTINSGNFSKAVWPGVNAWYGESYNDWGEEWKYLFTEETSTKRYEEDVLYSGFGLLSVKPEGQPITYDSARQGFVTRYIHVTYGSGFVITREMWEDDQYGIIGKKRAKALARSVRQTKENVGANIYNRGFNSSYTYGDGLEFFSAVHKNVAGGTFQNELTTAADLSEAALEQAVIDMGKWTDDRGLKIAVRPKCLVVPVDLEFEAERILNTEGRVATADNDLNAIKGLGKFPEGYKVNHWLTDPDAWFIRTDVPDGAKCFMRRGAEFSPDNDFETENAKYKATERYSFGVTDVRTAYGSPGA